MAYVKRTDNPNMGRPATRNRTNATHLRMSDAEKDMLTECTKLNGKSQTDTIIDGIRMLYEKLEKKNQHEQQRSKKI